MKNVLTAILLTLLFCFIISCDTYVEPKTWNVTVRVHNNSAFDVTDVCIFGFSKSNISKLEKGGEQTLSLSFQDGKQKIGPTISMEYKINGEQFDVEHQEDAVWYKSIPTGQWEWEENGVKYSVTIAGENKENEGHYTSLQHFTDGAQIDIFIDDETYRIEGGTFGKIHLPLLPPWLRDDYPASYFEFDRPK